MGRRRRRSDEVEFTEEGEAIGVHDEAELAARAGQYYNQKLGCWMSRAKGVTIRTTATEEIPPAEQKGRWWKIRQRHKK